MSAPHYGEPAWVEEGMVVYIRWDRKKGNALKCRVTVAAGNHARVTNPLYRVDRWLPLSELLVPPDDVHGYQNP